MVLCFLFTEHSTAVAPVVHAGDPGIEGREEGAAATETGFMTGKGIGADDLFFTHWEGWMILEKIALGFTARRSWTPDMVLPVLASLLLLLLVLLLLMTTMSWDSYL